MSLIDARSQFEAPSCEVCQEKMVLYWDGPIRNGQKPGKGRVYACQNCSIRRLHEDDCIDDEMYRSESYRALVDGPQSDYIKNHDWEQAVHLRALKALQSPLRGKTVLDVGCGAGLFLDHITGIARNVAGVEPGPYNLKHTHFSSLEDTNAIYDMAVSFNVIEHVYSPLGFIKQIKDKIKKGGEIVVCTPNMRHHLFNYILPEYTKWFYRTQHRWYFDDTGLMDLFDKAGLKVERTTHIQFYDYNNFLHWIKEGKPGRYEEPIHSHPAYDQLDLIWRKVMEVTQEADYVYIKGVKA